MRRETLFGIFIVACALAAHAEAATSQVQKAICKPGMTTSKSAPIFSTGDSQQAYGKLLGSKNFCFNEKVFLGKLNQLTDEATCICTTQAELEKVGCADGQTQPTVTTVMSKDESGCVTDEVKISKCVSDPKAAYEAACKSGAHTPFVATGEDLDTTPPAWNTDSLPTFGVGNSNQDAIMKALVSSGVPEDKARDISQKDPDTAAAYIKALAFNDPVVAKSAATTLNINANLADFRALSPADGQTLDPEHALGNTRTFENPTGINVFADTGTRVLQSTESQCNIPGVTGFASRVMGPESGCGSNTTNPNSPVQGPYQFMCTTWNTYSQNTGNGNLACSCTSSGGYAGACPAVNDPVAAGQVVNAQYALYQGRYGSQCAAAGASWDTCSYAIHFLGEGGFTRLLSAQQTNPGARLDPSTVDRLFGSGVYAGNAPIFINAGTVGGILPELDRRLAGGGGGTYAGYQPGGVLQSTSPFALYANQSQIFQPAYAGSPFAQTNPLGGYNPSLGLFGGTNPYAAMTQTPYYQQPAYQQPIQQTSMVNPPITQPITTPSANLTLQSHSISSGASLSVAWSSVNMSNTALCSVTQGSTEIARANQGTKTVANMSTSTVFTLTCTATTGERIIKTDSVEVR